MSRTTLFQAFCVLGLGSLLGYLVATRNADPAQANSTVPKANASTTVAPMSESSSPEPFACCCEGSSRETVLTRAEATSTAHQIDNGKKPTYCNQLGR